MPRYHWSAEAIETALACCARGGTYDEAGAAVGLTKHAVAGLIYRMRIQGDPRLPEALRIKSPGRQPKRDRNRNRDRVLVEVSAHQRVAHLPPVDERNRDRVTKAGIREGTANLLRARLRAGQHLVAFPLARAVAERMGMAPRRVRPGIGDITVKGDQHHA